jgi:hypothetical protein
MGLGFMTRHTMHGFPLGAKKIQIDLLNVRQNEEGCRTDLPRKQT